MRIPIDRFAYKVSPKVFKAPRVIEILSIYLSMQRKWLSIFGQLNDIKLYIDKYVYVQTSVDLRHCARPAAFIWSFKSVLNESRLVLHS